MDLGNILSRTKRDSFAKKKAKRSLTASKHKNGSKTLRAIAVPLFLLSALAPDTHISRQKWAWPLVISSYLEKVANISQGKASIPFPFEVVR